MIDTASVKLLAPLPAPPQMRDFLCFEKHLIQAFARMRHVRAATTSDPEKALREMETSRRLQGAENLVRAAELLQAKPFRRVRHRSGRDVAGLFENHRL